MFLLIEVKKCLLSSYLILTGKIAGNRWQLSFVSLNNAYFFPINIFH